MISFIHKKNRLIDGDRFQMDIYRSDIDVHRIFYDIRRRKIDIL